MALSMYYFRNKESRKEYIPICYLLLNYLETFRAVVETHREQTRGHSG